MARNSNLFNHPPHGKKGKYTGKNVISFLEETLPFLKNNHCSIFLSRSFTTANELSDFVKSIQHWPRFFSKKKSIPMAVTDYWGPTTTWKSHAEDVNSHFLYLTSDQKAQEREKKRLTFLQFMVLKSKAACCRSLLAGNGPVRLLRLSIAFPSFGEIQTSFFCQKGLHFAFGK